MSSILKIIAVVLIGIGVWMTYMGFFIISDDSDLKKALPIFFHLGNMAPIVIGISVLIYLKDNAAKN